MKGIYGVYGASGFGKEVIPLVYASLKEPSNLFFIDDIPKKKFLMGYKILTFEEFLAINADNYYVTIAIANGYIRKKLTEKCIKNGVKLFNVKANNVVIMDNVNLGHGYILCPFVTLTSNIKIGKCFHANIYSYVAHDCIIGDFVTFAPCVKCNGNVHIEDYVYIGTGAIIFQGMPDKPLVIGRGSIIGAGSVVTKDVPSNVVAYGSPAKIQKELNDEL